MNHRRTVKTFTMHLYALPDVVFPLLCPAAEYDWIATWKCDMIYSDSGRAERDGIFQTDYPHDGPTDTWYISRHARPRLVEFIRVNGIRAIRYTITLHPGGGEGTKAEWHQVITGLNDEGDAFVDALSDEAFAARMQMLQKMLNHYFSTGRMPT